jgi:hypothetical protein
MQVEKNIDLLCDEPAKAAKKLAMPDLKEMVTCYSTFPHYLLHTPQSLSFVMIYAHYHVIFAAGFGSET